MPARPPPSIDMLQSVRRPSIESCADAAAGVLEHVAGAAGGADPRDDGEDDVLARDAEAERAVDGRRASPWACSARAYCVAMTCVTSDEPMPKARQPSAPWVEVWLSPHTSVMPGSVMPCSGPTTWTMPWRAVADVEDGDAGRGCICGEADDHAAMVGVDDRGFVARVGRHVVVGRRERAIGAADLHACAFEPLEGIVRAVVEQMAVDVEERVAVGPIDDDMAPPDLLEHRRGTGPVGCSRGHRHGALLLKLCGRISWRGAGPFTGCDL